MKHIYSIFLFCFFAFNINAQEKTIEDLKELIFSSNSTKVSGQWFLSYQKGKDKKNQNFNNFTLKRGYINIKKKFGSKISGRITSDISVDKEGDGKGDVELRLKYCYLKYGFENFSIFYKPAIEVGLVHRPSIDFEQTINRYRVQGKMYLERNGIMNSGDYGLTFTTLLGNELDENYKKEVNSKNAGKYGSLAFGIYNGGGYHAIENNENKTFEYRLTLRPFYDIFPYLQFSYIGAIGKGNIELAPEWNLHSGMLSFEHKNLVLTGMYFQGLGNSKGSLLNENSNSIDQNGYSIFTEIKFKNPISIIGRYDFYEQERQSIYPTEKRYIFGVAYHFYKKCKFLIDYEYIDYDGFTFDNNNFVEAVIEVGF